ncbi:MAG: DUF2911 domain-containing protein [Thermoanaerobaculia bacterium]|nr:DUF2911 domain-containing protein [Thermoanaerobaculia bacterium]
MIRTKLVSLTTLALALALALPALAVRGDDAKRKSKNGKTEGTVAGVQIVLEYGRPNVAGRAIWGALVPYGKIWRTGADEATTISFSKDVLVQGQKLAAGTYALFTIPGEKEWTVVFNKTAEQWGAYDYDEKQDALRVTAKPGQASTPVESLDFVVDDDDVVMRWENVTVGFSVKPAA